MLIICPHCSQKMKGPANNVGATARCPKCERSFVVRPVRPPAHLEPVDLPIIEGVPLDDDDGNWVQDVRFPDDGPSQVAPSRRDRSAAILDEMAHSTLPVDSATKESQDWYVVVSDFEMDGPYTGREIVAAIRMGKLKPETRLQRGQTRTTVAELALRLREQAKARH